MGERCGEDDTEDSSVVESLIAHAFQVVGKHNFAHVAAVEEGVGTNVLNSFGEFKQLILVVGRHTEQRGHVAVIKHTVYGNEPWVGAGHVNAFQIRGKHKGVILYGVYSCRNIQLFNGAAGKCTFAYIFQCAAAAQTDYCVFGQTVAVFDKRGTYAGKACGVYALQIVAKLNFGKSDTAAETGGADGAYGSGSLNVIQLCAAVEGVRCYVAGGIAEGELCRRSRFDIP